MPGYFHICTEYFGGRDIKLPLHHAYKRDAVHVKLIWDSNPVLYVRYIHTSP